MLHTVIVQNPVIFDLIQKQIDAKRAPLSHISCEVYAYGNIRIVGKFSGSASDILSIMISEFNPDTVFFLSESYPVSDEKFAGDIILPNVFFSHNPEMGTTDGAKQLDASQISSPVFLEHYPLQGDYNFDSFGLSVGGIHVSGNWDQGLEDFRIQLRLAYENDTFDSELYSFVHTAKTPSILEKIYPIAYIATENPHVTAKNLWSIVGFIIGSIDSHLIFDENIEEEGSEEAWIDGSEFAQEDRI
ncbi:MAG: hypothetical protein PHH70_00770 [Candidatus Gracilibacteria bacterium]|nr:hypothetical protein [Candidatus Gracilibacteria bacterium]